MPDAREWEATVTNQAVHDLRHKRYAATLHSKVRQVLEPGGTHRGLGRTRRTKPFGREQAMRDTTLFEAIGGAKGVLHLAHAWHQRVMADEVVAHAFSHGFHPRHTERLAAYWSEAWGGPATYSERYGSESSVVRMHSGNGPHEEMDRRAVECFDRALDDVGLADPALRGVLHEYFAWAATNSMASYPESADQVPGDLRIPRWSWEGLQR